MAGLLAQQLILLVIAVGSCRVYGTLTALENCSSVPEETFRLYNAYSDPATQGGMLQVCRSGIWTAVCNQGFGCANVAPPACRTLGYGGENLRVATINDRNTGPWNDTIITNNYYQCSPPIPATLHNCTLTNSTENACSSVQLSGVGVWCLTFPLPVPQCTTGAVRLVGGNSSREGRVEYCYDGAWTQICSDFGMNEAIVACRQLGFSEAIVYQDADQRFGITSNFSLIEKISCSSAASESSLSMCTISATCATQCNTFFTSFYGIRCLGGDACQEGSVRLVNASTALEGRVEVCHDGVWGPVCGGGLTEAYVICKILGYDAAPRHYATSSQYGSGDRPFAYQITECFGWEMNLTDCDKTQQFNCSRSQAVSVVCRDGCTDGALRLVAGSSEREGMVEVCADQTWRAVAHTAGWGMEEAEVVCRQLSLQTTGATTISFGGTNRSVLFTDVHCIGTENKLMDCTTNQLSYENGSESSVREQVAGVSCNTQQSYVSLSTSTSQEQTAVTTSTQPSTTMTPITVPTPSASGNQQLIEYILAALVAVVVAISILLGVSLCVAIYKLKKSNKVQGSKDKQNNLDDVKQQETEIVYDELDAVQTSKRYSTVADEIGNNEAKEQRRCVMEENIAYASVSINEAGKKDSEKEEDPTYT